jgi:hypothetical protein
MKKIYLFLALMLSVVMVNAQNSLTFAKEDGTTFTDNLNIQLDADASYSADFIHITNTTGSAMTFNIQLVKQSMASGATIQMCFDGNCLEDTIHKLTINAGETYTHFDLLYSYENTNASVVKVNFLDTTNTTNLQSFTVNYKDNVALPTIERVIPLSLSAYPNPATNYSVIKYSIPTRYNSAKVVIRNMLGSVVKTINVKGGTTGKINLSTTELNNGVYFYSIIADGSVLSAKKLVVKH